jgi:F0F1-type ATP synthase assembly protein I
VSSNGFEPRKPRRTKRSDQSFMMAFLGVGLSVAVELAVAIGLGWYLGNWIDEKMGWAPYGMFAGVVLFFSASLTHAIIVLNHLNKRMNGDV